MKSLKKLKISFKKDRNLEDLKLYLKKTKIILKMNLDKNINYQNNLIINLKEYILNKILILIIKKSVTILNNYQNNEQEQIEKM